MNNLKEQKENISKQLNQDYLTFKTKWEQTHSISKAPDFKSYIEFYRQPFRSDIPL